MALIVCKSYIEKYNLSNLILRGYILAITHFVTQFTHVLRHPGVRNRKKRRKKLGKTVLKMWSQICGEKTYLSTKLLLEKKVQTLKTTKNKKKHFLRIIGTKLILLWISETTFSLQFSLNFFCFVFYSKQFFFSKYFFLVSFLSFRISRNRCKLGHKLQNSRNCVGPTLTLWIKGWCIWSIPGDFTAIHKILFFNPEIII